MKRSIGLRVSTAIFAAILSIVAFSFLPTPVRADKAGEAAQKAGEEVLKAEIAAQAAKKAKDDADAAAKKAGAEKTPEKGADEAAKAADDAAKAADDAQDEAQKKQEEFEAAPDDVKKKEEAEAAAKEAEKKEGEASTKEKESDKADKDAENAEKNKDVKNQKKTAHEARKKARAARRAAARARRALRRAERLHDEKSNKGTSSKTDKQKEELERLKKRLEEAGKLVEDGKQDSTGTLAPPSTGETAQTKTANGLRIVTFDTLHGRVIVNLPDDIRAGDTISGTVIAEPKGQTKEEQAKNRSELNGLVIEIDGKRVEPFAGDPQTEREAALQQTVWIYHVDEPKLKPGPNSPATSRPVPISLTNSEGKDLAQTTIPIWPHLVAEDFVGTEVEQPAPLFNIPTLGQTGRPIVITGAFDGNSSNTTLRTTTEAPGQDLQRDTAGHAWSSITESPRAAVFQPLANFTGVVDVSLKEGNVETKGTYRNVGVNLSAPKTNLLKGEETRLRIEANGLQGIKEPVPLTLESQGVITMEGGAYQPMVIQPSQVSADGRYLTTRRITGVQAGGWAATATVETHRFNVCLQNDSSPASVILWNTVTGDYIFTTPEVGKPLARVTLTSLGRDYFSLARKGTVTTKGCVITLEHNAPDRRVTATFYSCEKTGSASVQSTSPNTSFTITDRNTTDNTCPAAPLANPAAATPGQGVMLSPTPQPTPVQAETKPTPSPQSGSGTTPQARPGPLDGEVVHVESAPGGGRGVWRVNVKLSERVFPVYFKSDKPPNLKVCDYIKIGKSHEEGTGADQIDPYVDSYDQVPDPNKKPPTKAGDKKPEPPPEPPKTEAPKTGETTIPPCKEGDERVLSSEENTYTVLDGKQEMFLKVYTDTDGAALAAKDFADYMKKIAELGDEASEYLPDGDGAGGATVGFLLKYLEHAGGIIDEVLKGKTGLAGVEEFTAEMNVGLRDIVATCTTVEVCRGGKWVQEKRFKQSETKRRAFFTWKATKDPLKEGRDNWEKIMNSSERLDPAKAAKEAKEFFSKQLNILKENYEALQKFKDNCK